MYNSKIPSFEDLNGLSLVFLRAIALSWLSTDFWALLTEEFDPEELKKKLLPPKTKNERTGTARWERDEVIAFCKQERDQELLEKIRRFLRSKLLPPPGVCLPEDLHRWVFLVHMGNDSQMDSGIMDLLLFHPKLEADLDRTFQEYFNYKHPLVEDFAIHLPAVCIGGVCPEWKPDLDGRWRWENLPPVEIVLGLPEQPGPIFDEAVALAAYNDSGPGYLFSCC